MTKHANTYIFQPALLIFVFINIWRVTSSLRWAVNPNITFNCSRFGIFSLIQTRHTTFICRFFRMSKAPSYSSTTIVRMNFGMAFGSELSARQDSAVWIVDSVKVKMYIKFKANKLINKYKNK